MDDRAPKLIARALSIQDRKSVQYALLIIKEGCLYPEFQLQKYVCYAILNVCCSKMFQNISVLIPPVCAIKRKHLCINNCGLLIVSHV